MSVWKKIATPSSGHLDSTSAAAAVNHQNILHKKQQTGRHTLMSVWKKIATPSSGHLDSTSAAAATNHSLQSSRLMGLPALLLPQAPSSKKSPQIRYLVHKTLQT
jgi:hypothetical protein